MKKKSQPFETREHDLTGFASLDFYDKKNFRAFTKEATGYDPQRYEPIALKIFMQGKKPIITLFALDKYRQAHSTQLPKKLPVKKIKLTVTWQELFNFIKKFDLVVANTAYDIEDILVVNK